MLPADNTVLLYFKVRAKDTSTPVDHKRQVNHHLRGLTNDISPVVINRTDSVERRYIEEDEAAGYSRIEDIKPGKGKEDVDMKDVHENGMTDEEFLNRY